MGGKKDSGRHLDVKEKIQFSILKGIFSLHR